MREKLQNASDFEDIFDSDVKLLAEIAAFLRSREDIAAEIKSFADKYRAEYSTVGTVGSEGEPGSPVTDAGDYKDEFQGGF